jgi:hypothetical protein
MPLLFPLGVKISGSNIEVALESICDAWSLFKFAQLL